MNSAEKGRVIWRTSSYTSNGETCVEVGWHVSSYTTNGDSCVEVGRVEDTTLVRDSKARTGPELAFPAGSWHAFLGTATAP